MAMGRQYLVLVRHGQSEANASLTQTPNALYYSTSGSDPAIALTPTGQRQANELATLVAARFSRARQFDRLYCTDFRRVQQTADAIEQALGYKATRSIDPRLNKRSYGKFWNLTRHGVSQLFPDEYKYYLREGDLNYRPPEGENYPDVFSRINDFVTNELSCTRAHALVVTHSVVLLAFQRLFEGIADEVVLSRYEAMELPNCAVLTYCRETMHNPGAWMRCPDDPDKNDT